MKFKYLASLLTIAAGLSTFSKAALADIVVEWQPGDNAANIQKAINSGDKKVIIPNVGKRWLIGQPIYARQANQKILFQPGVILAAQKGAFKHKFHSLITIKADNVTLSGYEAQLRMRKGDYINPSLYEKSEWRHNINVRGARNFVIEGLTLKDSGGDGIHVTHGPSEKNKLPASKFSSGIIKDVTAINNYRQGLSIVSGKDISVTNSTFKNTHGTDPASGVDLEPDHPWQKLANINFKNTKFINNERNGINIGLWKYHGAGVTDVSINFDRCESVGNGKYGVKIQGIQDGLYNGPQGNITLKNCSIAQSGEHGIFIRNDQVDPAKTFNVKFDNVSVDHNGKKSKEFYQVLLHNTLKPGGLPNIHFGNNFVIRDSKKRPALFASHFTQKHGLSNVHGIIKVENPHNQPTRLGSNLENVTLKFTN